MPKLFGRALVRAPKGGVTEGHRPSQYMPFWLALASLWNARAPSSKRTLLQRPHPGGMGWVGVRLEVI